MTEMTSIRSELVIGLAQLSALAGDLDANLARHLAVIEEAARQGVSLLVPRAIPDRLRARSGRRAGLVAAQRASGAVASATIRDKFEFWQLFLSAQRAFWPAGKLGERRMAQFTYIESLQPTAQNASAFWVPSAAFGCLRSLRRQLCLGVKARRHAD